MVLTHIIVLHLTSENRIEYADVYNVPQYTFWAAPVYAHYLQKNQV